MVPMVMVTSNDATRKACKHIHTFNKITHTHPRSTRVLLGQTCFRLRGVTEGSNPPRDIDHRKLFVESTRQWPEMISIMFMWSRLS